MEKSFNFSKLARAVLPVVMCFGVITGVYIMQESNVIAANKGGGSSSTDGGNWTHGRPCSSGYCFSGRSYGATWRVYKLKASGSSNPAFKFHYDEDADKVIVNSVNVGGNKNDGGSLAKCKKYGATEYYRLGLEVHGAKPRGIQAGLTRVKEIMGKGYGGTVPFVSFGDSKNTTDSGSGKSTSVDWGEAKRAYEIAKKRYPELLANEWKDISMFCWNPEWENDSSFKSNSFVEASDVTENITRTVPNGVDPETGVELYDTVTTPEKTADADADSRSTGWDGDVAIITVAITPEYSSDTYEATFYHKLKYDTDKDDDGLPDVKTRYNIKFSNGKGNVVSQDPTGIVPVEKQFFTVHGYENTTSSALAKVKVKLKVPSEGNSTKTCSQISYNHKTVNFELKNNGDFKDPPTYSGTGGTKACIVLQRGIIPGHEPDEGGFWAESRIVIPANGTDVPGYTSDWVSTAESSDQDRAEIKLSTDEDHLTVKFEQVIKYAGELWDYSKHTPKSGEHAVSGSDTFPDICAGYSLKDTSADSVLNYGVLTAYGTNHCTNKGGDNSGKSVAKGKNTDGTDNDTGEHTIQLAPGEIKRLCQTLTHDSSNVSLSRSDKHTPCYTLGCIPPHEKWEYSDAGHSGNGTTELCVEVTRPENPPEGDDPGGGTPYGSGSTSSNTMYAGETAEISWRTKAKAYAARRLVNFQAISYLVPASQSYDPLVTIASSPGISEGNTQDPANDRSPKMPCEWFAQKTKQEWCDIIGEREEMITYGEDNGKNYSGTTTNEHIYNNEKQTIYVPDFVGYKYCNSAGYQWEYWISIGYNGAENWQPASTVQGGTDAGMYWTVYNAACRTIAKKPSMAAWNSGLFATGAVKTSSSKRYFEIDPLDVTPPVFDTNITDPSLPNPPASMVGDVREYGSWSEYLSVFGDTVKGLASGSSYSRGSHKDNAFPVGDSSANSLKNSPMTISNADSDPTKVGNSGIILNSTLRTRLAAYLKNPTFGTVAAAVPSGDITGTQVYSYTGNLTITSDIKNNGSYNSIYNIPQAIIFVDGDVNISGSVTQVDAWIIATGTLNTCKNPADEANNSFRTGDATTDTQTTARGQATRTVCDKQLTFNAPIFAGKVDLRRTYGSDPESYAELDSSGNVISNESARYTAAEVFNLSAESYLWGYAQASRYKSSYTEAYVRELAPRY